MAESRSLPAPASFLGMLDPEDRAALISVGRPRRYNRGATIVIQGDHSDTVFVLVAGRVKVSEVTPDGREIMLAVDGPGDLLGEFEAVDPDSGPRTAANVALERVECRELTGEGFRGVLQSHPRIALMLLRWIIRRLKAADRRRIDATSLDTTHRLARFLLELADNHARADPPRVDIDVPLTQEELASLIAASRDTVVRAITSLRSRGFIATARRRITILDINALRQYVPTMAAMHGVSVDGVDAVPATATSASRPAARPSDGLHWTEAGRDLVFVVGAAPPGHPHIGDSRGSAASAAIQIRRRRGQQTRRNSSSRS